MISVLTIIICRRINDEEKVREEGRMVCVCVCVFFVVVVCVCVCVCV